MGLQEFPTLNRHRIASEDREARDFNRCRTISPRDVAVRATVRLPLFWKDVHAEPAALYHPDYGYTVPPAISAVK